MCLSRELAAGQRARCAKGARAMGMRVSRAWWAWGLVFGMGAILDDGFDAQRAHSDARAAS
jgi:hypothetical protein